MEDKEVNFFYCGTKFLKWTIKFPAYLLKPRLRLSTYRGRFPEDVVDFVEQDILEFAKSFKESAPDISETVFEGVYGYNNYVLIPPVKGINAPRVGEPELTQWGIDIGRKEDIWVDMCKDDSHNGHEFMAPFYKTNGQLVDYYNSIMSGKDDVKKMSIKDDYEMLLQINSHPLEIHDGTKFHCMGHAFDPDHHYIEVEWTERLHHCIKNNLPEGVGIFPSYKYGQNFKSFQQTFSQGKDVFFFFRSIPDLIFLKNESTSSMYIVEEQILEIKPPEDNRKPKKSCTPSAHSQLVSGLHTLAILKVIRRLKKGISADTPVICKGLLVIKKTAMLLFTLKVCVAELSRAGMSVSFSEVKCNETTEDNLPLALICAGINKMNE